MTKPLSHPLDIDPDFDPAEAIAPQLSPSRRADGWTADRQRAFCEAVAAGQTVENAARQVGLSPSSAYAFRNTAKGAAFAIGWTAAQLLQRQRLADLLASRAFGGQTLTVTRASGETVERHFFDNRLAMAVLTRLDRLAAGQVAPDSKRGGAGGGAAPAAEVQAARLAAGEWDRYLDLLANDATPARAGLFLAARTVDQAAPGSPELAAISALARADLYDRTRAGVPAELDTADLDVEHRSGWTAEQWARAEAAGLLSVTAPPSISGPAENADGSPPHSQHSPRDPADEEARSEPIWWCDAAKAWRTSFPPPDDFDGDEEGRFGSDGYERELAIEEEDIVERSTRATPEQLAAATVDRDAYLAALAGEQPGRAVEEEGEENDDDEEDAVWNFAGYDNGCDVEDWVKVTPEDETERAAAPSVGTP